MTRTTVVQRSPDLGLRIKLQRSAALAPSPASVPDGPWWAGWYDAKGARLKQLTVDVYDPWFGDGPRGRYRDGLWDAVVEGVAVVAWTVTFTPVLLQAPTIFGPERVEIWRGQPVQYPMPLPRPPKNVLDPYPAPRVVLPETLTINGQVIDRSIFWPMSWAETEYGAGSPAPVVVAAGNTLSVSAGLHTLMGDLRAVAFADDVELGAVSLVLRGERIRINPPS